MYYYTPVCQLTMLKRLTVTRHLTCIVIHMCICVSADDAETSDNDSSSDVADSDNCQYELIGVTVHTGTADGGHYYSFIRDRLNKNELGQDRWYDDVSLSSSPMQVPGAAE